MTDKWCIDFVRYRCVFYLNTGTLANTYSLGKARFVIAFIALKIHHHSEACLDTTPYYAQAGVNFLFPVKGSTISPVRLFASTKESPHIQSYNDSSQFALTR